MAGALMLEFYGRHASATLCCDAQIHLFRPAGTRL